MKLLSVYNTVLSQLIPSHEKMRSIIYLSHKIQNELIELMAKKIRKPRVSKITRVKYVSTLFGCANNAYHSEINLYGDLLF
jgi:hypothetical protein